MHKTVLGVSGIPVTMLNNICIWTVSYVVHIVIQCLRNIKLFFMFIYCDINMQEVVRLEKTVAKT